MRKKILIALAVLLVLGGLVGGIAFYQLNGQYGLLTARAISHDLAARPETRLRVSIDTVALGDELLHYLPEDVPLPRWLPWDLPELLPWVLPREIAVLGGSDFQHGTYNLTVFANEQKGGPALPDFLNTRTEFRTAFPAVEWAPEGFVLAERGLLSLEGTIPLPFELEDQILELWSPDPPEEMLKLHGGHLAEGVIDNHNGDILTLVGALAPSWNSSLEQIQNNPQYETPLALVDAVRNIRVAIDFENVDTLLLQFRVDVEKETGGQLEFLVGMMLGLMEQQVKVQYGLGLEKKSEWKPEEEIYVCDVSLIGVESKLRDYFRTIIPAAQQAQPAE